MSAPTARLTIRLDEHVVSFDALTCALRCGRPYKISEKSMVARWRLGSMVDKMGVQRAWLMREGKEVAYCFVRGPDESQDPAFISFPYSSEPSLGP
jgi:hypothetical protein